MKEEDLRRCLKCMGVESIGIYVYRGTVCIAPHCSPNANLKDIKDFLQTYLAEGQKILL